MTEAQIIHCLECDTTYPERDPVVKICPECSNTDMTKTVYLQSE